MKICPTCQQTYADDSLNFCLNDGAVLAQQNANAEPQKTVFMNSPPPTGSERGVNQTSPENWGFKPPVAVQTKPKAKAWLWVLGIFGAVILLCGGGFVGLVALVANSDNNKNNNISNSNFRNTNLNIANGKSNNILTDDLSGWKLPNESLGITDYQNNEFSMTSKSGGYYFVLLASNRLFRTDNATTRISVKNTTGTFSQLGYGLTIHNNIAVPLAQDYAFLIDSVSKGFRIVKHQARKETVVVGWTDDDAIRSGSQLNVLEVKDNGGKMSFSINGKLVKTIEDTDGIKSGVVGLYASGGVPIAFSNLQSEK